MRVCLFMRACVCVCVHVCGHVTGFLSCGREQQNGLRGISLESGNVALKQVLYLLFSVLVYLTQLSKYTVRSL